MIKKRLISFGIVLFCIMTVQTGFAKSCNTGSDVAPVFKGNKEKFKISIIRSGEYWQYATNFMFQLNALKDMGWINEISISPEDQQTVPSILNALAAKEYSDYIYFDPELYFNFGFKEERVSDPKFQKILQNSEVDLMISFGTRSGRVLSRIDSLAIPVIVVQTSDPLKAGIIQSCDDSGKDNLTVRCDLKKYIRQIKVFYDIIQFKRLGLIYEDTEVGRSIAALDHIKSLSKEKGFEIISNTEPAANAPDAPQAYLQALKKIAPKIDAMFFTIHGGLKSKNLPDVMAVINQYKIPTFAMEGPEFVKQGVLFSISSQEQRATGRYNARKIACILTGSKPRDLDQKFNISPMIAINLKEAMLIGWDPPIDILGASDEIYEEITIPGTE